MNSSSNNELSQSSTVTRIFTSTLTIPYNLTRILLRCWYAYFIGPFLDRLHFWRPCPASKVYQPKIFGKLPSPWPISEIAPELLIYTKSSHQYTILLDSTQTPTAAVEQLKSYLKECDRFVVITHGFMSHKNTSWLHDLKEAILQSESRTKQVVAILGWGSGSNIGLYRYNQASSNALETGKWLGNFLKALRKANKDLGIYGIGHSLGAHLMGVAGQTSKSLDRITGLDPAGVGFQDKNQDKRLHRTDAPLVDVIHTDGQDIPYFGTLVPLGLIDFYPNYGWNQPTKDRARNVKPELETDQNHKKVAQQSQYGGAISDSHSRAIDFFIWSVRNERAFRTNLRLDGKPDVETAVHRVLAATDIAVEMGYYCDVFIEDQIRQEEHHQAHCKIRPRITRLNPDDDFTKYDPFAGYFYVHTNATAPWC